MVRRHRRGRVRALSVAAGDGFVRRIPSKKRTVTKRLPWHAVLTPVHATARRKDLCDQQFLSARDGRVSQ
jgi:hypothetical protein